mgnify:CR=1 FL=1
MELGFRILDRFASFSNSLEYKFSGLARGRFARKFLDLVQKHANIEITVESSGGVAVFPGNNSDLFEKDRGAIGRRGFVEICFGFQSVGPQIFRPLGHGNREIGSAMVRKQAKN